MTMLVIFLLLGIVIGDGALTRVADTTMPVDEDCVNEMKHAGIKHVIVRCYTNIGMPDSKCPDSLEQATSSGMTADVYIYPCPVGDDPAKQVTDTIKNVGSNKVGRYWIIIDNFQWKDQEFNRKFVQGLIAALVKNGKDLGFQINKYLHGNLFGHSFTDMSKYPLWNREKDRDGNCKPFVPFGGWKQPFWKQYDTGTMCWGVFLSSVC